MAPAERTCAVVHFAAEEALHHELMMRLMEAMVWLQYTATLFLTGAVLIAVAARLSYANIEPSRAKAARRREVFEAFIARKRGASDPHPHPDRPKS